MRTCPQCNRTYPEDLNFCLNDGSTLLPESQIVTAQQIEVPTVVRSAGLTDQASAQAFRQQVVSVPTSRRRSGLLFAALGIVVFLILGAAAGVIAYLIQESSDRTLRTTPDKSAETLSEKNDGDPAPDWIDQEKQKLDADQKKLDDQRQKLEDGQRWIELSESEPDNYDAQIGAAEFYYDTGRFEEAIGKSRRALELRPDEPQPMVFLGNNYFEAKNYTEARSWYQKALEKNPDSVLVRTDLGLTYVLEKKPDYDRAIGEFNRALEIDPNHAPTLQNLVVAYLAKGDAENAGTALKKFEEADPSNPAIGRLRESLQKLRR